MDEVVVVLSVGVGVVIIDKELDVELGFPKLGENEPKISKSGADNC